MGAALDGRVAHKTYPIARPRRARFWVTLFGSDASMLAMIEADKLGQLRTGAASGLATRGSSRGRMRGSRRSSAPGGKPARSSRRSAACARSSARTPTAATPSSRATFCAEMSALLGLPVEPADDLAAALAVSQVAITMTNASEPVLFGAQLAPGTHVNAAGSNRAVAAEIDAEVVRRSAVVAVENVAQAKVESGDLLLAERAGAFDWSRAVLLSRYRRRQHAGPHERRRHHALRVARHRSVGHRGGSYVYDRCVERGVGREVDMPG